MTAVHFITIPPLTSLVFTTARQKAEQLTQLSIALKTGREETMRGMGLHRIAQLNDIEAAGGVASFCQLLLTDVEELQRAGLDMLANLIALQNGAGNELSAGEAFAQSGACQALVQVMGNRVMELQLGRAVRPEVERKALRVVFHICKSRACQNALRKAGGGVRLRELLASDSPSALETKIEAVRCLKKYVRKNTENILELTSNGGVALLCELLGTFLALRDDAAATAVDGAAPAVADELFDVALEAILSTICECIHVSEVHGARGVLQFPTTAIASFVTILQNGDRMNRMLASQVLIQVSQEPTMIARIATERVFIKEMMWMLDSDEDSTIASEILYGLCQTTPKLETPVADGLDNDDAHETMLRVIYELDVLDLVLKKLQACVVGDDQFVGEINFQRNLLGIIKCFSAESAAYADYICSRACVPALSAFLLSKKTSLIPLVAQTLMNLCEFNPAIFHELLDRNASDFFQRLLQTPPDENRYSALRYFGALLDSDRAFSVGVLDTLFLMASGRDAALKTKSLALLAKLTGIKSITTLLDPLPVSPNDEIVALVAKLRERVVGPALFPGLMSIISTSGDVDARVNAIKCIRCAIDGGEDTIARMVELDVFRVFCVVMRKWMDGSSADVSAAASASEKQISTAVLQLLYLILNSSTSLIASAGEDDVRNLVTVVTEFIVSQPSRLAMGIRIVRLFITDRTWKNCFFTLYAVDSAATTGHAFLHALMNGIEQSSSAAGLASSTTDTVFEDCMTVLKELVLESANESMVNLLISAGVHTSLLELLRDDASPTLVTRALELLEALTQTRRVRLLILEAGAALTALVSLYDRTTLAYTDLDSVEQETARQISRILVHLSSDPLEFRKMLYDHRSVLPSAILRNVLAASDDVSVVAEDMVLNLVESDFATCPLWIDVIETSDIQLAFRIMVVAKRPSVQVTAARKLTDIVFSTPEKLEDEATGLSPDERATLVSTLIGFLVDFDPRTSVIGVLALTLLLRHGQVLNEMQMEQVAVDGAISLVYWMQKGTERHQENVVSILHDGVTDAHVLAQFYAQLQSPAVLRADAFIIEMGQQIVDLDVQAHSESVLKRCDLLTGMLATMDVSALTPECREIVDEVTLYLLGLLQRRDDSVDAAFVPKILAFLALQAASDTRQPVLKQHGVVAAIVALLEDQKTATEPSADVVVAAQRLLKALCMDDMASLVAANGVDTLVAILSDSTSDATDVLELFDTIVRSGPAGKRALMDSPAVLTCLEQTLVRLVSDSDDEVAFTDALVADDCVRVRAATDVCTLVFSLCRARAYREQVLQTSALVPLVLTFLDWLVRHLDVAPTTATHVLTRGLAFLEAAVVSEEHAARSELERIDVYARVWRVYLETLRAFTTGHSDCDLFVAACDALASFVVNRRARAALELTARAELDAILALQGFAALESALFSRECAVAMLELVLSLDDDSATATEETGKLGWVTELLVHVLITTTAAVDSGDVGTVLLLVHRFCATSALRASIIEHSAYAQVVETLTRGHVWRQHRRRAVHALALLGEDDALDAALLNGDSVHHATTAAHSDRAFAMRCVHCRQIVPVPRTANVCAMPCPFCHKPVADAVDGATASVSELPSAHEGDNDDGDAHKPADSAQEINCQNCSKLISLPDGIDSTEFACPFCFQAPTISKTSSSMDDCSAPPPAPVNGVRSSPSTSVASAPSLDVRDTKVVSCGHCSKHLIVKNGASAVKCPSCQGVSKLSTTTST